MGLGAGHKRSVGRAIERDLPEFASLWSRGQGAKSDTVKESPEQLQTSRAWMRLTTSSLHPMTISSDRAPFATRARVVVVLSLASWLVIVSILMLIRLL